MHSLHRSLKQHPVAAFIILTMLWSFTWWTLMLTVVPVGGIVNSPPPAAFGYMILGGFGPTLAGLLLTRLVDGPQGMKALLVRLRHWHVGKWWWALVIPYGVNAAVFVAYGLAGHALSAEAVLASVPAGIGMGITAGLMEEFGWRGFLLPKLLQRYSPLKATLLVGLVWGGVWHLYADYLGLGNLGWASWPLILLSGPVLLTAYAALLTWLYQRTQASMLVSVLFHACISSSALIFGLSYASLEEQVLWTTISVLLTCAVAAGLITATGGLAARPTPPTKKMRLKRA